MNYKKLLPVLLVSVLGCLTGYGQTTIYKHDFGTSSTEITATYPYVTGASATVTLDTNLTTTGWTNSSGAWSGANAGSAGRAISLGNSLGTPTITLTLNVAAGYEMSVVQFNFWRGRAGTGAQTITSMTIGGITVYTPAANNVPTTGTSIGVTNVSNAVSNLTGSVLVVISLKDASGTGRFSLDDFELIGTVSRQNITSNGTGGGNWATGGSWAGGKVPASAANVTIASGDTVTMDSSSYNTRTGSTTVNTGATLATGALAYNNNGTTTVYGTFRLDNSGSVTGNAITYDNTGTTSTLTISTPTTIAGADLAWPAYGSTSPYNVSVTGGGLTINSGVSRTVPGTFLVASAVAQNGTLILNGICQMNGGPGFSGSTPPTYGSASTLVYNIGGTPTVGKEWTTNSTTVGLGVPQNVTIQNSTTLTMPTSSRGMAGNLNINSGNLTLSGTDGSNLTIGGNWTRIAATATFTPSSRTIIFYAISGTQTVTVTGGGTETFFAVSIQGSGNILKIASSTNIAISGSSGLNITSSGGSIDLNGQTLTLSGGGTIGCGSSGVKNITSTSSNGTLLVTANAVTITIGGAGSLTTDANTIVKLQQAVIIPSASVFTINGTLQMDGNSITVSIITNSPIYGSSSTLSYSGTTFTRGLEWNASTGTIGTTPGFPNNVLITNSTTLTYYNVSYTGPQAINGKLDINAGSVLSFGTTTTGGALTVPGDVTNAGTISLGAAIGDDLKVGGNYSNTGAGTFTGNNRAIWFTKTGTQTVSTGTIPLTIPFVVTSGGGTTVQLLSDVVISSSSTGTNVITFGSASDVIEFLGIDISTQRNLTIGSTSNPGAISGSGSFRTNAFSNLTLLGTGSIGTLNFTSGSQNLGTFTMNRQAATVGCVMGTPLTVNTSLVLTNGLIDLGTSTTNNLTLGASATTSGASSNSYVLAYGTGATGGQLIKTFSGAGAFTYPIGDNTTSLDYSPATLTFVGGTYGGTVGVRVVDAAHPNNGSPTDYLTRYWQVSYSGVTPTTYTFAGTYLSSGDIVGTEAASVPGRWNGTTWTDIGGSGIGSNTCTVSGNYVAGTNEFSAKTGSPPPYYRSAVAGSWSTASNWQSSTDNVTWITSAYVPDSAATAITIRNLYNITISSGSVTADDITVDSGATLTVSGGTFILNNGAAAIDMQVNGTLAYSSGTFTQGGNGMAFGAGATYNHAIATATLTLPIATWNSTSTCNVTGFNAVSATSGNSTLGQTFGNFTWNNTNTGYLNIEQNNFKVSGTLTVGPLGSASTNLLSFGNAASSYTYTGINSIAVSGGILNCAGGANVTLTVGNITVSGGTFNVSKGAGTANLTVTNGVLVTGVDATNYGAFVVSNGSGTATLNVGTDVSISVSGLMQVLATASSPSTTVTIGRDLLISGALGSQLNLEAVSSTSGVATVNVTRDFICSASSATYQAVDFGTGTVSGNIINIGRNFDKSGSGFFYTTSTNATTATGFSFNGTGTQTLSYTGTNSERTSYIVQTGKTVQLLSNLTLGLATTSTPVSSFTVSGTLDFGTYSIIAGNTTNPRFLANTSSTLITSNTGGMGGTTATGSLQSFGAIGSAAANGTAAFAVQVKYTFNANTTTPFPNGAYGSPIDTVNINATVTSNIPSANLTISGVTTGAGALNVNNGGTFILNATSNNLFLNNNSSLNIASGGTFDNNGENQITLSSGTPTINITGTFITRDVQGFVGASTAIPSITPVLNTGSTVEYGLSGNQAVQGSTAPTYQNVTFSGSGTKTLASANAVVGTITVSGSAIFDASNFTFGGAGTNITMTGTSQYKLGGSGSKPDATGTYTLGSGTTFEFYGSSATNIRPGVASPVINYYNVTVSGTNVANATTTTAIQFQAGGTFTVNNGATFKLANTAGFNGASNTAISSTNNPTIKLFAGSTVEYYGASQTLTPITYSILTISGTGTKSISSSSEILVGDQLNVTASTLQIDSSKLLTVTNAIKNTSGNDILVLNGGNLVQIFDVDNATTNANTGNIRMTRTTRALNINDYVYWGSPVKENVFSQIPSPFEISYDWNLSGGLNGAWNYLSTTTTPGRGFISRLGAATAGASFNFIGTANNGVVRTYGDSYDNGATTTASGNTILLGNPYPSAIDAATFISDPANSGKIGGTLYFWTSFTPITANAYNTMDYATWNGTGGTKASTDTSGTNALKPTGKITSGQGFFAVLLADYNVTFNNTMRLRTTTDNAQFFKTSQNSNTLASNSGSRIWLNLTNQNNAFRQMLVGYVDGATNGYDNLYDGHSITTNQVDIYSINSDKNLVIQGRALPFSDADTVPIGYRVTEAGDYSIAIDEVDGLFLGNQDIYLEDTMLNVIHDLKQDAYTFASASGNFDNRFILRYTNSALGVPTNTEGSTNAFINNHLLQIQSKENIKEISIYDITGKLIISYKPNTSQTNFSTDFYYPTGVYMAKIKLDSDIVVTKKIMN